MSIFRSWVGVVFGLLLLAACDERRHGGDPCIAGYGSCESSGVPSSSGTFGGSSSSVAADGVVVQYPVQASGNDIVTNFYAYGPVRGTAPASTLVESMLTSTGEAGIDLPETSSTLSPATVDKVLSDFGGVSIRTSVGNPGRNFKGCIDAAADHYKTLKIMKKGQSEPIFDLHTVYYHHKSTKRPCFAVYLTGLGINGPGVCICDDDDQGLDQTDASMKTAVMAGANQNLRAEARQALPQWGLSPTVVAGTIVVAFDIVLMAVINNMWVAAVVAL